MFEGSPDIYKGRNPINLYTRLTACLGGDPEPLLDRCDSDDDEVRAEARAELGAKVAPVLYWVPEFRVVDEYLDFMDWVNKITETYRPLSDVGYQPRDWWDVVGLWFNRNRSTYRQMYAVYRAMYLALKELPLPTEAYQAMTASDEEAEEMRYDESTDQQDRAVVARSSVFHG